MPEAFIIYFKAIVIHKLKLLYISCTKREVPPEKLKKRGNKQLNQNKLHFLLTQKLSNSIP